MATRSAPITDAFVTVDLGHKPMPAWLERVANDFGAPPSMFEDPSLDEFVATMDDAGVGRAILTVDADDPGPNALRFVKERPDRFALSVIVDPTRLLADVWALEDLVGAHPVVLARIVPFLTDTAPTHPHCYPVYAKCVELDLPLSINTGIPGPPLPGECQNPVHLDRVCYDFPDLRLCMAHGADPWWDLAIRLMVKYPNLHLMTSAWSPRYLPPQLLQYMNGRGREKVIFASDHPILPTERAVKEAQKLDLRPEVLDAYLGGNADRLFFSARQPHRR